MIVSVIRTVEIDPDGGNAGAVKGLFGSQGVNRKRIKFWYFGAPDDHPRRGASRTYRRVPVPGVRGATSLPPPAQPAAPRELRAAEACPVPGVRRPIPASRTTEPPSRTARNQGKSTSLGELSARTEISTMVLHGHTSPGRRNNYMRGT